MDATDQAALVASGEVSPIELLEAAIERIERIDPALNAVVIRWFDHARATASDADLPARTVSRRAVPDQRPVRRVCGAADQQRQRRVQGGPRRRGCRHHPGQPLPRGRAGDRRPHEQPRARQRAHHRARRVGTDPQPLGHRRARPVDRAAVRRPPSRRGWCRSPTPATAVDRSASRRRAADWSDSSRVRGASRSARSATRAGLSVEHCVSRTVRDSAALLDATCGPGIGDTVIAPAPGASLRRRARRATRVGCASASSTTIRRAPRWMPSAPARRSPSASCSNRWGTTSRRRWPKALEDNTFGAKFGALWSTNMGVSRRRFEEQLGRPLQDHEFEPMNRVQAEFAAHFTSVDYALALSAVAQYRRRAAVVVARRLGSAAHADARRAADQARHDRQRPRTPDVADAACRPVRAVHATVQHQRPAGDQPPAGLDAPRACPSACSSSPPTVAKTCSSAIASQLEQARPWAHRTPGI